MMKLSWVTMAVIGLFVVPVSAQAATKKTATAATFSAGINLQGSTLDFNRGGSKIYDNGHFHFATDDYLFLDADTQVVVKKNLQVGDTLIINNYKTGTDTGSKIYDDYHLHVKTDDNLYLDAPTMTFLSGGATIANGLTVTAGTVSLPADSLTSFMLSDGTVNSADIADNSIVAGDLASDIAISSTGNISGADLTATSGMRVGTGSTPDSFTALADDSLFVEGAGEIDGTLRVDGATALSAALTVDTTTLAVDATNNRVGIGTASPTAKTHIVGAADTNQLLVVGNSTQTTNILAITDSSANNLFSVNNRGAVTAGNTSFTGATDIGGASNPIANLYSTYVVASAQPATSAAYGTQFKTNLKGTGVWTGGRTFGGYNMVMTFDSNSTSIPGGSVELQGLVVQTQQDRGGSTVIPAMAAIVGQSGSTDAASTVTTNYNIRGQALNTGIITTNYDFYSQLASANNTNIANDYGLAVEAKNRAGTSNVGVAIGETANATNNVNLLIGSLTPVSGSYSIYNASSDPNYFAGSVTIGSGGSAITKHLTTTESVDFGAISSQSCTTQTLSYLGAATTDSVIATPLAVSGGIETVSATWNVYVSTGNIITIKVCNPTGSPTADVSAQTWRVDIWRH